MWHLVAFAEKVCDTAADFGIWWLAQHGIKSYRNQPHSFHILRESFSHIPFCTQKTDDKYFEYMQWRRWKSKFTKEPAVQLLLSNHLQKKVACLYFNRELQAASLSFKGCYYSQSYAEVSLTLTRGINCHSLGSLESQGVNSATSNELPNDWVISPQWFVTQHNSFPSLLSPPLTFFISHVRIKAHIGINLRWNHLKYLVNCRLYDSILSPARNCSYSMTGMFLLRLGRSKKSDQGIRTWRMSGLCQW